MTEEEEKKPMNFHQMEIDDRILKAIAKLSWITPTLIQEVAIPLLLEGKDVLIRARTGSGKTAAFAIPVIQKILNAKINAKEQTVSTLVLAPSKELCQQIKNVFLSLADKCGRIVNCIDLSISENETQKHMLSERPDIVVSTPSRILGQLRAGNVELNNSLETLVIDEADLIFSFGYEKELRDVLTFLPSIYQSILASATLTDDVLTIKQLILHNPIVLKLKEPELAPQTQLSHYHIYAEEYDKATILYSLFKLHLIKGKSIVFVNSVDKCYKLKLFLEQFGIRSCLLNSELPAKSRCHAVGQFNLGAYDIIIASDEIHLDNPTGNKKKSKNIVDEEKINNKKNKRKVDKEFAVSRGIDFQCVSNVINFDFPLDISSYIHRAGRTARGNNTGSVLSFVNVIEKPLVEKVEDHLKGGYGTEECVLKNYQFKMEEIEPFRYRANDAWRKITRVAIRESRLKEIKMELFNCEKLKTFFTDNPKDLQVLRHDKKLHTIKVQSHLHDVPEYIIPEPLKHLSHIRNLNRNKKCITGKVFESQARKIYKTKMANPLLCAEIDFGSASKSKKRRVK